MNFEKKTVAAEMKNAPAWVGNISSLHVRIQESFEEVAIRLYATIDCPRLLTSRIERSAFEAHEDEAARWRQLPESVRAKFVSAVRDLIQGQADIGRQT